MIQLSKPFAEADSRMPVIRWHSNEKATNTDGADSLHRIPGEASAIEMFRNPNEF